jgi:hypothetical protein
MNAELERFFEECRADPWFRERPERLDHFEEVLIKIYKGGDDDPKWQTLDDRIREIIARKNRTLIERCDELGALLSRVFEIERPRRRPR